MDIDAALTLVSFVGFAVLFVSWILAPLSAAPMTSAAVASPQPGAAVPA
jgi:hypothetical protein